MNTLDTLANEALDAMELVRIKIVDLINEAQELEGNENIIIAIEASASKLVAAHASLEDIYSAIEDFMIRE